MTSAGDISGLSVSELLAAVGAKTPAPGGGAVASVAGALASALGRMVVAFSVNKASLSAHKPELERASRVLERAGQVLLELAHEDALAYTQLNTLQKLPEDHPERQAGWSAAVATAVDVPRSVMGAACDVLRLVESLVPITNVHLKSDLAIAGILADAAARSAWWNVRANLGLITDPSAHAVLENEGQAMLAEASARAKRVESACSG